MHNYLCWILQLMCLLLTPRIQVSVPSLFIVMIIHFSLFAVFDIFNWTLFWRDAPLFLGAMIVMIQQTFTYQENYLALQIYANVNDNITDKNLNAKKLIELTPIENPLRKKSIKIMLDAMQDV